jgi:D-sedoheptulose 7-phosphate isomerase
VFIIGNGGSAATASHFTCDLQKSLPGFRVFALTDCIPIITAWANDDCYENVFRQQLMGWIKEGDLLIAISGSGNSENVLRAVEYANEAGAVTIGLTGGNGGKLLPMVRYNVVVQTADMQHIEDLHSMATHLIYRFCKEEEKHWLT